MMTRFLLFHQTQDTTLNGATSASFAYDALDRRIERAIGGQTTTVLYDHLNSVQELTGGTPSANLLFGLGIDEMFARTEATGTVALLKDALGSTTALADSSGAVRTHYTYDPFGATSVGGSASSNTSQFTGRESDGTGLYYYRARYYDAAVGRFISEDPIGHAAGVNFYAYVRNSPGNYVDPMGLDKQRRRPFVDKLCSAIPDGRTFGGVLGVGYMGASLGGAEVILNYNTGEASAFLFGGFQGGRNGVFLALRRFEYSDVR